MSLQLRRTLIYGLLLMGVAVPALAQSTREEWLALRTRKEARENTLPGSYSRHTAFLTAAPFQFFTDSSGRQFVIGELRHDDGMPLAYARITFSYSVNGVEVGREWTYVHGGVNARIPGNNAYETLLMPGDFGFFKIWIPPPPPDAFVRRIYEAVFVDYAPPTSKRIDFEPPRAVLNGDREWKQHPERWLPRVFIPNPPSITGQQITGQVWNDDPRAFQGPSDLDNIFTYSIQVSVAVYQNGVISDVQSATAVGPTPADACRGEPVTGMGFRQSAAFTIPLANPANSVARYSVEWHETIVSPDPIGFLGEGGLATFAVKRECGWTATSNVPWVTILDGAASGATGGEVTVYVEPNPTVAERVGSIVLSGETYRVIQGLSCQLVFNPTVFLGPGRQVRRRVTGVPTVCVWGVRDNVPWLTAIGDADALWLDAEPNFTAATRSAIVTVGNASFSVVQSAVSRRTDFNNDGHVDLIWRHADGRIATWLMNGTQLKAGMLFSPSRWDGQPMVPVGSADLGADGMTDLLWQNTQDGDPALWHMNGVTRQAIGSIDSNEPTTSTHKIRAVADYNDDGTPDFVWQDETTGREFVWLMHAGRSPSEPMTLLEPPNPNGLVNDPNWMIVGSGDFNGDGSPDLLWRNQADGRIWVWKMRMASPLEASPIAPETVADLNWKIRAVADMNGDDKADLVWQHRVDGRIAVWLMDGTQLVAGTVIAQLADKNWEIVGPR